MVEQIAKHGLFDLTVRATGDVEIDGHHTTEDVGFVLGKAWREGARRQGGDRPLRLGDAADGRGARDLRDRLSGRQFFVWEVPLPKAKLGTWDTELAEIFFEAFARGAQCNLHIVLHAGREPASHRRDLLQGAREGAACGGADRAASVGVPSTKGSLQD